MQRDRTWMPWIGLFLPLLLIVGVVLVAPGDSLQVFGIRGSTWLLFACAPATSLCLGICRLSFGRGQYDADIGRDLDR